MSQTALSYPEPNTDYFVGCGEEALHSDLLIRRITDAIENLSLEERSLRQALKALNRVCDFATEPDLHEPTDQVNSHSNAPVPIHAHRSPSPNPFAMSNRLPSTVSDDEETVNRNKFELCSLGDFQASQDDAGETEQANDSNTDEPYCQVEPDGNGERGADRLGDNPTPDDVEQEKEFSEAEIVAKIEKDQVFEARFGELRARLCSNGKK